ncbi:MAG TPA: preprotein translocase subunit SecY [Verrucomicrobiae bacterium]|nr:preprotein translocase subunit SecY [Verrucomicrobiae bacterium]
MLRNIFTTFVNCFKIPELKSRILFTLLLLAVARVVAYVPIPGIDSAALAAYSNSQGGGGGMLGLYNRFAGGAYLNCAIGALGIMPYVSSSIILQMLGAVFPRLSKLAREEGGRAKIVQYGRYLTIPLCLIQAAYFANSYLHPGSTFSGFTGRLVVMEPIPLYFVVAITSMTATTLLLMWLGEQITDRGIGNGVSLIITIGIVAGLPYACRDAFKMFFPPNGTESQYHFLGTGLLLIGLLIAVIAGIIAITQAQRKVPVQYASRMVGRKMYQGGTNYLPLPVNQSNVMPIIFASSILMFPGPICNWLYKNGPVFMQPYFQKLATQLNYGAPFYLCVFALLILFFSYFWVAIQFNEIQIADDLKKNGGYIPGVRPGQSTSDYLHKALSRLTLAGAFFLVVIAVIPVILYKQLGISQNISQFFGGTSILIAVGVLLNTMRQVESHLMMRHYDGFLKKGRVRGRFN